MINLGEINKLIPFILAILFEILSPGTSVAGNAVTGVTINAGVNGQATLSGTFTTAAGVTLTSVKAFANPTSGGMVASGAATQINNTNLTWGIA